MVGGHEVCEVKSATGGVDTFRMAGGREAGKVKSATGGVDRFRMAGGREAGRVKSAMGGVDRLRMVGGRGVAEERPMTGSCGPLWCFSKILPIVINTSVLCSELLSLYQRRKWPKNTRANCEAAKKAKASS